MGKLLILIVVVMAMLALLGLLLNFLNNHSDRAAMGLKRSKKQMAALRVADARHVATLKEIRDLATDSETAGGDPLWSLVADKIDVALGDRNERDTR